MLLVYNRIYLISFLDQFSNQMNSTFKYFLILLVGLYQTSFSFPYQPIRKSLVYEYNTTKPFILNYPVSNREVSTKLLLSYKIDSAMALGNGDSLYVFNPTVNPDKFEEMNYYSIDYKSDGIFGTRMVLKQNGDVLFLANENKDTFLIKTQVPLNTTWKVNKSKILEATYRGKSYTSFLGLQDSIMHIELSTGLEIKVSKQYGIIEGTTFVYGKENDKSPIEYSSITLNSIANVISSKPAWDLREYFNYQPGDELRYYQEMNRCGVQKCLYNMRILKRIDYPNNDSLVFIYSSTQYVKTIRNALDTNTTIDTFYINKSKIRSRSGKNRHFVDDGLNAFGLLASFNTYYRSNMLLSFGMDINIWETNYIFSDPSKFVAICTTDTLKYAKMNSGDGRFKDRESLVLQNNLGIVEGSNYFYEGEIGVCGSHQLYTTLYFANIGGKIYGDSSSRILSTEDKLEIRPQVQIYPNPSSGKVNIKMPENSKIVVVDFTGKSIYSSNYNSEKDIVILENLSKGMYFLKVFTEVGNQETVKFIIDE